MPSYSPPTAGAQGQTPVQIPPGMQPYTMVGGHPIFKIGGQFFNEAGLPYQPGQYLGPQPAGAPGPGPATPGAMPSPAAYPPMPTYDQRMDQAAMPSGPVTPGAAGGYGIAAQAPPQPGPMDASLMNGPPPAAADASDLPMPAEKPPQPDQMGIEGGLQLPPTRGKRVQAGKPGQPSESDILNKLSLGANHGLSEQQQIAALLSQRLAANS